VPERPAPDPGHFDARAERYDRARPPYPPALWAAVGEFVRPGSDVIDLGAGSGQATAGLLRLGARVTAVEPGPALAAILRRRFPDVPLLPATAETADLQAAGFDVAVVATAVHWFDLTVVLPRLHRALRPGGRLAVWRNAFGDPTVAPSPFRRRLAELVARRGAAPRPGPGELDTEAWVQRLSAGELFRPVRVEEFRWSTDLDAEQVEDLFSTFSDWTAAEAAEAGSFVADLGGTVTEHYVTPLVVLERSASPTSTG
jgi:SAM-dependent methyltransferase